MPVQNFTSKDGTQLILSVFPANKGLTTGLVTAFTPADSKLVSENLVHYTTGGVRTRPARIQYMTNLHIGGVRGTRFLMQHFRTVSGVKQQRTIAAIDGGFWEDPGSGTFTHIGNYGATTTPVDIITGTSLVGVAVLGVKSVGLKQYNHTTLSDLTTGSAQQCYLARKHRGSIWAAGDPDSPEVLYKSNGETITDFTTGTSNSFNVDLGVSDPRGLTAICPDFLGRLYLGKYNSLYEMDTSVSTFPIRPITESYGIISHNAVVTIAGDLIYPSTRGLHSLQATIQYGDVSETFLSKNISNIWLEKIDFTRSEEINACFSQEFNSYLMVYPDRTTGAYNLLGYNITEGSFYHWDELGVSCVGPQLDPTTGFQRILFGKDEGSVDYMERYTGATYVDHDDGPYTSRFKTPPMFPSVVPGPTFRFTRAEIFFVPRSTSPITLEYQVDQKPAQTVSISQSEATLNGGMAKKIVDLSGEGQSITLDFSCTSSSLDAGAAFEILGYNLYCLPSGDIYSTVQVTE